MSHNSFSYNKRRPLDTHSPRVQELSKHYNISAKVIAYIRAAFKDGYTKNSLIEHIQVENKRREQAIEQHKLDMNIEKEQRDNLIKYTTFNIHFREGVIEVLNRLPEIQLNDILH